MSPATGRDLGLLESSWARELLRGGPCRRAEDMKAGDIRASAGRDRSLTRDQGPGTSEGLRPARRAQGRAGLNTGIQVPERRQASTSPGSPCTPALRLTDDLLEPPVLHQPPGRHRRRLPTRCRRRPAAARQPQRLQGVGTFRCEGRLGRATVIADGGHRGTGLLIPHRRKRGQTELSAWKLERGAQHLPPRGPGRVKHVFARMKAWKILRDCRERRRRSHRHARQCPAAQPRPRGVTPASYETREAQGRWRPTSPAQRMFSRYRTRCPRCPASGCTTRSPHRHKAFAHGSHRARPVVHTRLRARRGARPPRARCRPGRRDAPDS